MFAENDHDVSLCAHAHLYIGLDAAYCPRCKKSFDPNTKEYKQTLNCDRTRNIALIQPAPEHLYQPGKPGSIRPQPLLIPAPEHLYQPGESGSVREQSLCDSDSAPEHFLPANNSVREQSLLIPAPEHLYQSGESGSVREQSLCNSDSAPEHSWRHWVEVYWVGRGLKRHQYFRYMWMTGGERKLNRLHIPGGSVRSLQAANRMAEVEQAIDAGQSPQEIERLIKSWRK